MRQVRCLGHSLPGGGPGACPRHSGDRSGVYMEEGEGSLCLDCSYNSNLDKWMDGWMMDGWVDGWMGG